jgi:hypothetical protein
MFSTKRTVLRKTNQKMEFTVLSYSPCTFFNRLGPAPSVAEWEEISRILNENPSEPITDLKAQNIKILTHYRGNMLYCQGGVTVHRYNADGVNGYAYWPVAGTEEDVIINGKFTAHVKFN